MLHRRLVLARLLEHLRPMLITKKVSLLLQGCRKSKNINDLPQRLFATTVELSPKSLVLEESAEVVCSYCLRKLCERLVIWHFALDCLNDVENLVSIRGRQSDIAELLIRLISKFGHEIFIRSSAEIEPEAPCTFRRGILSEREIIDGTKHVRESDRIVVFQHDRGLLAFLKCKI